MNEDSRIITSGPFKGKKIDFNNYQVDMSLYTGTQRKVLNTLRKIKYGQLVTYKKLAKLAGIHRGARFTGNTMGKNKTPLIIPCHRVIKSDGQTGGFSSGIDYKEKMIGILFPNTAPWRHLSMMERFKVLTLQSLK